MKQKKNWKLKIGCWVNKPIAICASLLLSFAFVQDSNQIKVFIGKASGTISLSDRKSFDIDVVVENCSDDTVFMMTDFILSYEDDSFPKEGFFSEIYKLDSGNVYQRYHMNKSDINYLRNTKKIKLAPFKSKEFTSVNLFDFYPIHDTGNYKFRIGLKYLKKDCSLDIIFSEWSYLIVRK